jgi:NAD(P)-dependent dehydrogenase (short-subunit alcohol dehydrogenase family)
MLLKAGCVVALALAVLLASQRLPVPDPATSAVVITGTSSGIGRHAALDLACRGFLVFATVRSPAHVDGLKAEAASRGCGAAMHPVLADVTNAAQVAAARDEVALVLAAAGRTLAAVVTNAGFETMGVCAAPRVPSRAECAGCGLHARVYCMCCACACACACV